MNELPDENDRPTPTEVFDPASVLPKKPTPRLTQPPKRTQSGQHPQVTAMRRKLTSIIEGQAAFHDELDAKIDEATRRLRTPLPPELPKVEELEDEEDEKTPVSH